MQTSREIMTIVPTLPPKIDGIGDYSFSLAQQLSADYEIHTRFIVGDPNWSNEAITNASAVSAKSSKALSAILPTPDDVIFLHYAGHGYAKRGCPFWLVQALTEWCRAGGRLITMFHELYANRPLLSSALVTSPIQKHLAIQLMQISDRAFTSRQLYAEKIQSFSHHRNVLSLPVFSNIGEIEHPKPLQARSRELVVFGSASTRQRIYQQSELLQQIYRSLDIQTILDIGTEIDIRTDVPIQKLGILPVEQISQILSHAIAGVIDYPTGYLAKSSIFASYCSHGLLPIVIASRLQNQDGLEMNRHYWLAGQELDLDQAQAIANTAHSWYQQHCLQAQAHSFAQCLNEFVKSPTLMM
jgi:hypothetical protein